MSKRAWSFAATAQDATSLERAMRQSWEVEATKRSDLRPETYDQVELSMSALLGCLRAGLWGSGPFTVSLSGSESTLYMAVTVR